MNTQGLLLALILGRDIDDPQERMQLLLSGNLLGSSPIGLLLLAILANRSQSAPPVPDVKVPQVTGETVLDSAEKLSSQGLRVQIQEISEDAEKCPVVIQSPGVNSLVRPNSTVTLFVETNSKQLAMAKVPNVVAQPYQKAKEILQSSHFNVELFEKTNLDMPDQIIVEQYPQANVNACIGSTVKLYFNNQIEPPN